MNLPKPDCVRDGHLFKLHDLIGLKMCDRCHDTAEMPVTWAWL